MTPQRGGFVPSVIISHNINCRDVLVVDIKRTLSDEINSTKIDPLFLDRLPFERISGKNVLIVDDILGTGETLFYLLKQINECNPKSLKSAIIVQNDDNFDKSKLKKVLKPDYLGTNVRGWVIFPWEN